MTADESVPRRWGYLVVAVAWVALGLWRATGGDPPLLVAGHLALGAGFVVLYVRSSSRRRGPAD